MFEQINHISVSNGSVEPQGVCLFCDKGDNDCIICDGGKADFVTP
ncbi:hypothetical protein SAMN04488542_10958 [Fontibacillus panacisegetis]|uniref:Uncharacterized protein n=1 Tax=Fontibacillus panacisegetis TaxID=670482 RepID=A0A1G7K9F9_9BACL|nr:hypothetical protein [Fontibacillus panacisegetis]SDF33661.1 hypothetical protein SAMN04488542_10958 [Fontibacillus panacisegetis]